MQRTYAYRLYPSPNQEAEIERWLTRCARLYNAMLMQRNMAYLNQGISLSLYEQNRQLVEVRQSLEEYGDMYSQVLQNVALRLDLAFQAFFRRVKAGEKPGYPRFQSSKRYNSMTYPQAYSHGVRFTDSEISFSKLAKGVRFFQHRPLRGKVKTATIKRKNGKWYVLFSCDDVPTNPDLRKGGGTVGVDVGLRSFATLSTGEKIPNPKYLEESLDKLRRAQRVLSRRKKGSSRRKEQVRIVAHIHEKVTNKRRDHAFKVARDLVERFEVIAVEDLNIKSMMKNKYLSRGIADAGWGMFMEILQDKAEEAGATVIKVPPGNTSQDCSSCGELSYKVTAKTHRCDCGLVTDRDHNAAINILQRARTEPSWRDAVRQPVEARSPV